MREPARRKQYVEVIATHHIDGSTRPQQIIFAAGPIYDIEEVLKVARAKTRTTREIAKCYSIRVKGRETCLYEDGGRWFVEMKE